jgi:hypothetical protein
MILLKRICDISEGHLPKYVREDIVGALSANDGKKVVITIEEAVPKVTGKQHRFYRGYFLPKIVEFFIEKGDPISVEDAHKYVVEEVLKLKKLITDVDGKTIEVTASSADFEPKAWEDKLDMVRAHFAPYGLMLPYPNEENSA